MTMAIDPKILALVRAFNAAGIATRASCQGHGFPINREPYVVFNASERLAAMLSKVLRDDAESANPRLRWGWTVVAGFDDTHRRFYRLTAENPQRAAHRWGRHWLDSDIAALGSIVTSALDQRHEAAEQGRQTRASEIHVARDASDDRRPRK